MAGKAHIPNRRWVVLCVGLVLVAAASVLFFTLGFGAADHSRPVAIALQPGSRWVTTGPFRASPPGRYRASLSLGRKYEHREMECLADVGMPYPTSTESGRRTDCPPSFPPSNLEWVLLEDGRPAAQTYAFGKHAGEYSSASVGRSLGIYDLRPGRSYVVRARLTNAPQEVWTTAPKLELAFDDMASLLVRTLFFSALSVVMGVAGIALLIAESWRLVRKPPRPATEEVA